MDMKVGDLVTLKENHQTLGINYGIGVITMADEGQDGPCGPWKSFRVQWNEDWFWHDKDELVLVNESR